MFVFLFHLRASGVANGLTALGEFGYVGVSFFYILSGVVLVYSHRPSLPNKHFYALRAARVVPLYLAVLFGAWLINVTQGDGLHLPALAASVLLVQAWVPDRSIYFGVQPVFWSLSVEAFFYLCFPMIYRRIRRLQSKALGTVAVVVYATMLSAAALGRSYDGVAFWLVYIAPPVRLLEFVIGVVIGEALRRGDFPRIPSAIAASAVVAGFFVMPYAPASFRPAAVTLWPFVLVIAAAYQADTSGRTSLLAWQPMVMAGTWSYAFYLLHTATIGAVVSVFSRVQSGSYVVVTAAVSVATIAAGIAHHYLELPAQRRLRTFATCTLDYAAGAATQRCRPQSVSVRQNQART
jgi:peptidoglycan/LPS O-acetylase OafA/YrhL